MLRASVRDFVAGSTDHKRTRALRMQLPGHDAALLTRMAGLGWCGIVLPEAHGGLGLGCAEMAIVLEELGRGLLAEPLAATVVLGGRTLLHAGPGALRDALLEGVATGTLLPALAWQEEGGALDATRVATRARAQGGTVQITGQKRLVLGGGAAGYIVSGEADDGLALYWVEADRPGLAVSHEWHADGTPAARLVFDAVSIPATNRLSAPGAAPAILARALDEARVMASAELCGVMRETLAMTLEYMRTRVQFNKPIGSFQALQHRSVDLFVQQELAGAVLREAVAVLDGEDGNAGNADAAATARALIAARCKARASDAGLRITREAVQLHGAIAIQDECNVGLYLKRALVLAAWLGNGSEQRRRFMALSAAADEVPA